VLVNCKNPYSASPENTPRQLSLFYGHLNQNSFSYMLLFKSGNQTLLTEITQIPLHHSGP